MKTPEEIFDEAIKAKGLDTVSVKDADLYEAGLGAIKQALSIADVVQSFYCADRLTTDGFTDCQHQCHDCLDKERDKQ